MLQSLFCYILCSMAVIVKCDSLFYYKFQRRLLRSASVRFISKCKGGYCLYKVLRSLDWRVRSLGDVTAHGRVQDWPSRERLGTRLASPFSPFYVPLLTIDHPLSMICLLVPAFLVCKNSPYFQKFANNIFPKMQITLKTLERFFPKYYIFIHFLASLQLSLHSCQLTCTLLNLGRKITFLNFSKKMPIQRFSP